jgi:histone-lysine N-methyltransferase SETDB1
MANKEGRDFGDEYLAELDHIEVVEKIKEGYESSVTDIEDDSVILRTLDAGTSDYSDNGYVYEDI